MSLSSPLQHDASSPLQVLSPTSNTRRQQKYRRLLLEKMSELGASGNIQRPVAGNSVYENFRINGGTGSSSAQANFAKTPLQLQQQQQQQQLRGPQVNGRGGGDSAVVPKIPGLPQDYQQTESGLLKDSEEINYHQVWLLKQQAAAGLNLNNLGDPQQQQYEQENLNPDGLPSAPSSDGVVESVKDGHIRRLMRELTMLKAKLHEAEGLKERLDLVHKERDSAFQQVASVMAESDRRTKGLNQRVSELTSALAEARLQQQQQRLVERNGGGGKDASALKEIVERQMAEINTLKESVQRLGRENMLLKEGGVSGSGLSSRQPGSLGSGGTSSSVACCSQELEYLHKVVDTLKATVLEQQVKLLNLRFPHGRAAQIPPSTRPQSFPVISTSSRVLAAASGGSIRHPGETNVASAENSVWSVDGSPSGQLDDAIPKPAGMADNTGVSNDLKASSVRSSRAVQDDERARGADNIELLAGLTVSNGKVTSGVSNGVVWTENTGNVSDIGAGLMDNSEYVMAADTKAEWAPSSKANNGGATAAASPMSVAPMPPRKAQSQVIAARNRTDIPTPMSVPAKRIGAAEAINVSSGLGHLAVTTGVDLVPRSFSGNISEAATAQDMLEILRRRPPPPPHAVPTDVMQISGSSSSSSSSSHQGIAVCLGGNHQSATITTATLVRPAATITTTSQLAPQFTYEADVDTESSGTYSGRGSLQHLMANYPPQALLTPAIYSSSGLGVNRSPVTSSAAAVLSTYQTAKTTATLSPSDPRDCFQVVNKHMMGGGNIIFQQDPAMPLPQPQQHQLPTLRPMSQVQQNAMAFTAQALSPHTPHPQQQQQHQHQPYNTQLSAPSASAQHQQQAILRDLSSQPPQEQQIIDLASGPRVNSDRSCPFCGQDFSHVPMEDFQAHVYECVDEAGPETMKASGDDELQGGGGGTRGVADRTCPVCSARFEPAVPQAEFERHVHSHFGEENFEML